MNEQKDNNITLACKNIETKHVFTIFTVSIAQPLSASSSSKRGMSSKKKIFSRTFSFSISIRSSVSVIYVIVKNKKYKVYLKSLRMICLSNFPHRFKIINMYMYNLYSFPPYFCRVLAYSNTNSFIQNLLEIKCMLCIISHGITHLILNSFIPVGLTQGPSSSRSKWVPSWTAWTPSQLWVANSWTTELSNSHRFKTGSARFQ